MHKRAELWFAAAGFFAAVVFGIPPIVDLIRHGTGGAVFYILVAAAFALGGAFFYWQYKTPPWTVQRAKYQLEILDATGNKARLRKIVTLRSNVFYRNDRFVHRRLGGDGSFSYTIDPKMRKVDVRASLGETEIEVEFPSPFNFWGQGEHWIELEFSGCFPSDRESIRFDLDDPVHELEVQILFPATRKPTDCGAHYHSSGIKYELVKPEVEAHVLTWKVRRWFPTLRRGRYDLWWRW
jgi:hypothetical protein